MKTPSRSLRSAILGAVAVALCFHAAISAEDKPAPEVPKKTLTANEESQLDEMDIGFEKAYDLLRAKLGDEAVKQFRDALPNLEKLVGPEDGRILNRRTELADMLEGLRKYGEAVDEYRAIIAIRSRLLGPEDNVAMWFRNEVANMLEAQGKLAEAEQEIRAILPQMDRMPMLGGGSIPSRHRDLAEMLEKQGKKDDAEKEYRAVVAIEDRVFGINGQDTFHFRLSLAECLERRGKLKEALAIIKRTDVDARKAGWPYINGPGRPIERGPMAYPGEPRLQADRKRIEAALKKQRAGGK